jgi:SAM-dependent methyltransferase
MVQNGDKMGSISLKSIFLSAACSVDPIYRGIYEALHPSPLLIPPLQNRRRVGSAGIGRFLEAGESIFKSLNSEIKLHFDSQGFNSKSQFYMLDFGCGVGRVLSHFTNAYSFPIYACDVDASAVAFLQQNLENCIPCCNLFDPPLPFLGDFFHCIYSVSIWTHLSPESQENWLKELHRVAAPGALLLITTSGFAALAKRRLKDPGWKNVSNDKLEQKGTIYLEYPDFKQHTKQVYPGLSKSYGLAAHSPGYIKDQWSKLFEILEIKEACIDGIQDLVVMRKR